MRSVSLPRDPLKRRSRRIPVIMRIEVAPADGAPGPRNFHGSATNLNRYGAALMLDQRLAPLSRVVLINSRGVRALARVVSESDPHRAPQQYGIEFLDSNTGASFWGIHFPS